MVEETLFRDNLHVPTQEWLRQHTVWFEELTEEAEEDRVEMVKTALVAVLAVVATVMILAAWGGF